MTGQRRPWMAHPKRRDDVRLVLQAIALFLLIVGMTIAPQGTIK